MKENQRIAKYLVNFNCLAVQTADLHVQMVGGLQFAVHGTPNLTPSGLDVLSIAVVDNSRDGEQHDEQEYEDRYCSNK